MPKEHEKFIIVKSNISAAICKGINYCKGVNYSVDEKISERVLNTLANEFTDKILKEFPESIKNNLPKIEFTESLELLQKLDNIGNALWEIVGAIHKK